MFNKFNPFDKFLKNVEEVVKNAEEEMVMKEKKNHRGTV